MDIALTPEQNDLVQLAIETGRIHDSAEAVQQAMTLWAERERRRVELVASLDAADAALARGEGVPITKASIDALTRDVVDRCAQRISAVNR